MYKEFEYSELINDSDKLSEYKKSLENKEKEIKKQIEELSKKQMILHQKIGLVDIELFKIRFEMNKRK